MCQCLVLQLLAVAKQLLYLPVAVMPLGLATLQGPQASQDEPAMGGGAPATDAVMAILK